MSEIIAGIRVPDSAIARAATQLVRDTRMTCSTTIVAASFSGAR